MRRIHSLRSVHEFRKKPDFGNIRFLTERMGMDHHPSVCLHKTVLLLNSRFPDFRMGGQPLRGQAENKELGSLKAGLPAKENIQANPFPFFFCIQVAFCKFLHPCFPGKRPLRRRISSPVVIRHKDTGIARLFAGIRHLPSLRPAAEAALRGMKMCFI